MTNTSFEWVQRYSSNLSTTEQNKLVSISVKYSISIIIWSVFSTTLNIFPFWDGSQHCGPQKALFNCLRFYFHNTCIYKKCERYKEHSSKVKILLCTIRKTWWTAKQKSKNNFTNYWYRHTAHPLRIEEFPVILDLKEPWLFQWHILQM